MIYLIFKIVCFFIKNSIGLLDKQAWIKWSTKNVPFIRNKIDKQKKQLEEQYFNEFKQSYQKQTLKLPTAGLKLSVIQERLRLWLDKDNEKITQGKMTGCVYSQNDEAKKFLIEFSKEFMYHNPLHLDTYSGVRQMEGEILQMAADLYGQSTAYGVVTNGGTDSIFNACYAYREKGKNRGITKPNMILPISAHCAFKKAAYYLGIEVREIALNKYSYQVEIKLVQKAIDKNTIMLVGSAPSFAHNIIDPISKLGQLALQYDIDLHVDACLGGFALPFAHEFKIKLEKFNFTVPGVSSISCDNHKFGLAPKGVSILLYKNKELRHLQYVLNLEWSGGMYGTASQSGSRSGAPIAGAWFSMVYQGYNGFKENAGKIFEAQKILLNHIKDVKELQILGKPNNIGLAFTSKSNTFNIYCIHSFLKKNGWDVNSLQSPPAIGFVITMANYKNMDQLGKLIKQSVIEIMKDPKKYQDGAVAMYASANSCPSKEILDDMLKIVLDCYYKTK